MAFSCKIVFKKQQNGCFFTDKYNNSFIAFQCEKFKMPKYKGYVWCFANNVIDIVCSSKNNKIKLFV